MPDPQDPTTLSKAADAELDAVRRARQAPVNAPTQTPPAAPIDPPLKQFEMPYCTSTLELPQGVGQNARLTFTMNYGIEYINPDYLTVGAILNLNPRRVDLAKGWVAGWVDADGVIMRDGPGYQYKLSAWDFLAETNFYRPFRKAAEFWDNRFRLIPPTDYSGLDYFQQMGDVFRLSRPQVECRFRAVPGREPEHLAVYGVRPQD